MGLQAAGVDQRPVKNLSEGLRETPNYPGKHRSPEGRASWGHQRAVCTALTQGSAAT